MNCRPYKYIVGKNPVEKKYSLWEKALIKLNLKKREFETPVFELVLNTNVFKKEELLQANGQADACFKVIDKPRETFWASFVNSFGFYRNNKLWNPVNMKQCSC